MIKRIVKLLIAIVFRCVEKIIAFFQNDNDKPGTCVVLMYHDVTNSNLSRFIRQMEILPHLAIPVSANSLGKLQKGTHHVAVTFDDGFADTIEQVLPVLTNKNIPTTYFIPTAHLGKEAAWIADKERRKRTGPILSAENLKLLSKNKGVTIGSHGMNHRRLTEIKDDDARKELAESKKQLENITGTKVKTHSFPHGVYDARHVAMARKAGYNYVFTVEPTIVVGNQKSPVIGRVQVEPTDWLMEFKLKVLGAYRWHPCASRLKNILWLQQKQQEVTTINDKSHNGFNT